MNSATWTSKSGKTMTLTTKVIGETSRDHVYTDYSLTIDGKSYLVHRPISNTQIEIQIARLQKGIITIPAEVAAQIDAELTQRMEEISAAATYLPTSDYDVKFEEMNRIMRSE